ncbi:MAG: DUF4367 domain-containing protein [Bacillota bacterium]
MRRMLLLPLLFLAIMGCSRTETLTAERAISNMVERITNAADYVVTVDVSFRWADQEQHLAYTLWHVRPGLHKREMLAPVEVFGHSSGYDGNVYWYYDPGLNLTYVFSDDVVGAAEFHPENLVALLEGADAELLTAPENARKPVAVLSVPTQDAQVRVTLDTFTWLPVAVSAESSSGSVEVRYKHFWLDMGLGTEVFKYPEGSAVVEARPGLRSVSLEEASAAVSFTLSTPGYLPRGFSLSEVTLTGDGSDQAVNLEYRDGERWFVLTQSLASGALPEIPGLRRIVMGAMETYSITSEDGISLWWTNGGVLLFLQGNLPEAEMVRIAQSVR